MKTSRIRVWFSKTDCDSQCREIERCEMSIDMFVCDDDDM